MAKTNFYAVYGFNAVGVVAGWSKVQKVQKYIHGFNNKQFTTFQAAELINERVQENAHAH